MPLVGFKPTIPAFKRAKTVHALDLVATVFGEILYTRLTTVNTVLTKKDVVAYSYQWKSIKILCFEPVFQRLFALMFLVHTNVICGCI
jgi:hypothetical protein